MIRKVLFFLTIGLLTVALLCAGFPVLAAEPAPPSMEEVSAALLYHPESGVTVLEKAANTPVYAGSSVKIMSGLLVCEVLGNRLNETVHISKDMLSGAAGFRLQIEAGDTLTVEQLLYAALCGSYNDAYCILAYLCSGSVQAFVEQMNARAEEMGLINTRFTDPSGVDDASRTTAGELLQITLAAMKNPTYMTIACTQKYQMASTDRMPARTIHNRSALVSSSVTTRYFNKYCKGISAGATARGGQCVITMVQNGTERYVCLVLGGMEIDDVGYGYVVVNRMVDWVSQHYTYLEVASPDTIVCSLPVTVSNGKGSVAVCPGETLNCFLPAGCEVGKEITYSTRFLYTELEAPVEEGTMVGYLSVIYRGQVVGTTPLYTAAGVERSPFVDRLLNLKGLTRSRAARAGLIFFAVGLASWMIAEYAVSRHRRKKWDKYFSERIDISPDLLKKKRK